MLSPSGSEDSLKRSSLSDPRDWVDKHGDALFGYMLRYISDRSTAEDLVQETFLAALKGRAAFTGASSERTWLIGILKNKVVDHYRKAGRETPLTQLDQVSEFLEMFAPPDCGGVGNQGHTLLDKGTGFHLYIGGRTIAEAKIETGVADRDLPPQFGTVWEQDGQSQLLGDTVAAGGIQGDDLALIQDGGQRVGCLSDLLLFEDDIPTRD